MGYYMEGGWEYAGSPAATHLIQGDMIRFRNGTGSQLECSLKFSEPARIVIQN